MIEEKPFERYQLGDIGVFSKTITEADIATFAALSGDANPLHLDPEYAKTTMFGERIAHGMLIASFISGAAFRLLGTGAIYVSQMSKFKAPVRIGDTITATMEVVETIPDRDRVRMRTYCANQDGKVVLDGEAIILVPFHEK